MSNQNNEFLDDDCNDQIRLNVIHRQMALDLATDLLKASMYSVSLASEFPDSDLVLCVHALLTYQQYESGHPNGFQRSMSASMAAITEKLTDISESIDCAGAKAPLAEETKLTVLLLEHALSALKERWLHLNPVHTDIEYRAAILEFEKLLGL